MSDDNRIDLDSDISSITGDLLKDVQAAAAQVKKRKKDEAAKDARDAEREKSKKLQMIIIAAAAVVIILVSYWLVFARPQTPTTNLSGMNALPKTTSKVAIRNPGVTKTATTTPIGSSARTSTGRQSSQVENRPSDEYEQPSGNGGM